MKGSGVSKGKIFENELKDQVRKTLKLVSSGRAAFRDLYTSSMGESVFLLANLASQSRVAAAEILYRIGCLKDLVYM